MNSKGETNQLPFYLHHTFYHSRLRYFNTGGASGQIKEQNTMGVIGRLDQQVDELIIRPLGERAGNESQAPPKTVKQLPPAGEQENQREDEDKSDRRSQDLPVWLL